MDTRAALVGICAAASIVPIDLFRVASERVAAPEPVRFAEHDVDERVADRRGAERALPGLAPLPRDEACLLDEVARQGSSPMPT